MRPRRAHRRGAASVAPPSQHPRSRFVAQIADYHKKVETIKVLREQYCVREKHAKEVANEIKIKDDVNEAIEWLRFHKEKDWGIAEKLKAKRDAGEKDEVQEESDVEDGVEIYVCEPTRLW